jgi:pyruvate decarboxylase
MLIAFSKIYVGSISHPDIKEKVESAKLILSVGCLKSDFNTGNVRPFFPAALYSLDLQATSLTLSRLPVRLKFVPSTWSLYWLIFFLQFHSDHVKVQHAAFPAIGMKELLPMLTARLEPASAAVRKIPVPVFTAVVPKEDDEVISQAWLWPTMGKFFKPKDVILAETGSSFHTIFCPAVSFISFSGTSSFGILDVPLPEHSVFLSQILWGSIGWTVGSTLGAAFAARDLALNRTILFIGDGSLQLTVQELSVMLRHGLKPIIFVLNNSGYTIEVSFICFHVLLFYRLT